MAPANSAFGARAMVNGSCANKGSINFDTAYTISLISLSIAPDRTFMTMVDPQIWLYGLLLPLAPIYSH